MVRNVDFIPEIITWIWFFVWIGNRIGLAPSILTVWIKRNSIFCICWLCIPLRFLWGQETTSDIKSLLRHTRSYVRATKPNPLVWRPNVTAHLLIHLSRIHICSIWCCSRMSMAIVLKVCRCQANRYSNIDDRSDTSILSYSLRQMQQEYTAVFRMLDNDNTARGNMKCGYWCYWYHG